MQKLCIHFCLTCKIYVFSINKDLLDVISHSFSVLTAQRELPWQNGEKVFPLIKPNEFNESTVSTTGSLWASLLFYENFTYFV